MDQNFATKSDFREQGLKNEMALAAVRSELKQDISDVRTDITNLRSEVKKLGPDLTIKLGVMMIATVGAVSTIIGLIR